MEQIENQPLIILIVALPLGFFIITFMIYLIDKNDE